MTTLARDWASCTAMVTGARRGIGRAYAVELARRGCRVVVTSREPEREMADCLGELARVSPAGSAPHAHAHAAVGWDLRAESPQKAAKHAVEAAGGAVHILVHAAHVFAKHRHILATSPDELGASLMANVVGTYALARAVCRGMSRDGFGRILFVGSLAASLGGVGQVTYIAEKSAMKGLAQAFAAELGRRGVLVNVVEPGIVDTENVRSSVRDDVLAAFARRAHSGRLATVEDVVRASIGLVDPGQGYVTGQVMRIAGGTDSLATIMGDGDG